MSLEAWVKADTLPVGDPADDPGQAGPLRAAHERDQPRVLDHHPERHAGPDRPERDPAGRPGLPRRRDLRRQLNKLYVNGVLKDTRTAAGQIAAGGGDLYIGAPDDGAAGRWLGTIDEPAVYPLALTPAKAQSHYDTGRVPLQRPAVPTNVTATPESSSRIRLRWTDNADNENAHVIERKLSTQDLDGCRVARDVAGRGVLPRPRSDPEHRLRLPDPRAQLGRPVGLVDDRVGDHAPGPDRGHRRSRSGRPDHRHAERPGQPARHVDQLLVRVRHLHALRLARARHRRRAPGTGTTAVARSQAITGLQRRHDLPLPRRREERRDRRPRIRRDVHHAANAPSAPTGLNATATSGTAINLSWTDVSGETSYVLERSTDSHVRAPA